MHRLTHIIVSIVLVVSCTICFFYINNSRSEHKQEVSTLSEDTIDVDSQIEETVEVNSQVIEESSQETSRKETVTHESHPSSDLTSSKQPTVQKYTTPNKMGKFKSYTDYKLLSRSSPQWTKIQCHKNAYTDNNGLRKIEDYYCVAMGSYYTKSLGDLFEIQTKCGSFKVIICDFKADIHTDTNNQYTLNNGCMVEFYVDTSTLSAVAKRMGDISYINDNFWGEIVAVNKIGNYFRE